MRQFISKNLSNLSFALAILILLGILASAMISLQAFIESNNQVSHTLIVQGILDETLALLTDAETGARGYVITGDEVFLEPYNAAVTAENGIQKHLQDLRELTSDNPKQQKRLDLLEALTANKLATVEQNIELRRNSGFDAAQAAVLSGEGREAMDEIRAVINEMSQEESNRLKAHSDGASANLKNVLLLFAIGGSFALLLISFSFSFLNQQIRERRRAEQELLQLNQELDQRVEQRTAELAVSERSYRALADDALIAIFRTTVQGEILYVNETAVRMMGFDSPEALMRSGAVTRWQNPEARQRFLDILKREGRVELFEGVLLKTSGEPMDALINARVLDGELTGTVLDITERKRVEELLAASERRFRGLIENAPDGITVVDAQGTVIYVSPSIERILGYSQAESLGRSAIEYVHPQDSSHLLRQLARLTRKPGKALVQYRFRHKDGSWRWLESAISNLIAEPSAEGVVFNYRDITERKQADEALARSEEEFRTLADNALVGIYRSTLKGEILYVNETMAHMMGFETREAMIQSGAVARWRDPSARQTFIEELQRTGRVENFENVVLKANGEQVPILISARITGDQLTGTVLDMTERKRAEEERLAREAAERANQAKSEFLSRMSHELRTPMNSILGFAQLLKMDELSPDQLGSLEQILRSGRHLLDLINEVLDIARIESGRIPISPEPVHLDEALQSAVELIQPLADKRGISIQIRIPSSRDVFVTADRQRLKQVLLNLLSNAVKYNREGGQIHITASLLVDGFMHLAVRDTGLGIPPEKMERLFVPFERLELDPDLLEGTGLGLALSKGLVEAMGGRIGAQSTVGVGSTFWFDLQLTTQQKEAIVMAEVDDYLKSAPGAKRGLVLYVEDNLSNIQLIEKILARFSDVNLISAMQGRLALDLARQHKPGLILLDLHLPDMHGSDVLQQLRAEVETKDIPIVVMSADATHGQIERTLAAGANAYLTKPIDVKEFLKVVGEMLGT
jgi:PAS domain S-box-containing protein